MKAKAGKNPETLSVRAQQIETRRKEVELRKAELELKLMERQVKLMEETDKATRMTAEQQERNIREARLKTEAIQAGCAHRKGGSNLDGFYKGSGDHSSLIRHTFPMPFTKGFSECTGTIVHCQRCHKTWGEDHEDYQEMLAMPTNNMPSGNPLFTVTYHQPSRVNAA